MLYLPQVRQVIKSRLTHYNVLNLKHNFRNLEGLIIIGLLLESLELTFLYFPTHSYFQGRCKAHLSITSYILLFLSSIACTELPPRYEPCDSTLYKFLGDLLPYHLAEIQQNDECAKLLNKLYSLESSSSTSS